MSLCSVITKYEIEPAGISAGLICDMAAYIYNKSLYFSLDIFIHVQLLQSKLMVADYSFCRQDKYLWMRIFDYVQSKED